MSKKGIVIRIENNEAVIMTNDFQYYKIKGKSYMILGQEYTFKNKDIILPKKNRLAIIMPITSVAAALVFVLMFFRFFIPNPVAAYIDIDINPSLELSVDSENRIVSVSGLNKDSEKVVNKLSLKGKSLSRSITQIVKTARENGYINEVSINYILCAVYINEGQNEEVLYRIQKDCFEGINNTLLKNMDMRFLNVEENSRKESQINNMSMGRYILYSEYKKKGAELTIEDAKEMTLANILNSVGTGYGKNLPSKTATGTPYQNDNHTPSIFHTPTTAVKTTPLNQTPRVETSTNQTVISTTNSLVTSTPINYYSTQKNEFYNTPAQNTLAVSTVSIPTEIPVEISTPKPDLPVNDIKNTDPMDLNGDGLVDSKDKDIIMMALFSGQNRLEYDLNGDGRFDKVDAYLIVDKVDMHINPTPFQSPTPITVNPLYDLNMDGTINIKDLELIKSAVDNGSYDKNYDLNYDRVVNYLDYNLVKMNLVY